MNIKEATLKICTTMVLLPGISIMRVLGFTPKQAVEFDNLIDTIGYGLSAWLVILFTIIVWGFAT